MESKKEVEGIDELKHIFYIVSITIVLLFIFGTIVEAKDIEQEIPEYIWDHGIWPNEPIFGYVYDQHREHLIIPDLYHDIQKIWMECEVKGWWVNYKSPADVVSVTQDYGAAQVNIIHKPNMENMGLDFYFEGHRIWYAVYVLWENQGWQPWSCKSNLYS